MLLLFGLQKDPLLVGWLAGALPKHVVGPLVLMWRVVPLGHDPLLHLTTGRLVVDLVLSTAAATPETVAWGGTYVWCMLAAAVLTQRGCVCVSRGDAACQADTWCCNAMQLPAGAWSLPAVRLWPPRCKKGRHVCQVQLRITGAKCVCETNACGLFGISHGQDAARVGCRSARRSWLPVAFHTQFPGHPSAQERGYRRGMCPLRGLVASCEGPGQFDVCPLLAAAPFHGSS
jgi:hypothetical protein